MSDVNIISIYIDNVGEDIIERSSSFSSSQDCSVSFTLFDTQLKKQTSEILIPI